MGGILGLIAGASVLSIVELCFHLLPCGSAVQQTQNRVHPSSTKTFFVMKKFAQALNYFVEFSKITDVDGMRYTNDKNQNLCSKIFWTAAIIFSSLICCAIIIDTYNHAEKSPVAIRIDQKIWSIDDVRTSQITKLTCWPHFASRSTFLQSLYVPTWTLTNTFHTETAFLMEFAMDFHWMKCEEVKLMKILCNSTFWLNFRWKVIEPGSYICNFTRHREIYDKFYGDARLVSNLTYSEKLNYFNRLESMQQQNFCYEQQPSALLSPTIAYSGLCYTFNHGKDVLDRTL